MSRSVGKIHRECHHRRAPALTCASTARTRRVPLEDESRRRRKRAGRSSQTLRPATRAPRPEPTNRPQHLARSISGTKPARGRTNIGIPQSCSAATQSLTRAMGRGLRSALVARRADGGCKRHLWVSLRYVGSPHSRSTPAATAWTVYPTGARAHTRRTPPSSPEPSAPKHPHEESPSYTTPVDLTHAVVSDLLQYSPSYFSGWNARSRPPSGRVSGLGSAHAAARAGRR